MGTLPREKAFVTVKLNKKKIRVLLIQKRGQFLNLRSEGKPQKKDQETKNDLKDLHP